MPTQRKKTSPTKRTASSSKAKSPATPFARVHATTRDVSPSVPARRRTNRIKPGMSPRRDEQRVARRAGARKVAERLQTQRPRPKARPVSTPVKVMAKTPPPPVNRGRLKPKPSRVSAASMRTTKTTTRRLAGAAAAASFLALKTSAAPDELSAELASLERSLKKIQSDADFEDSTTDVSEVETLLQRVIELLESARDNGYRYQNDLEKLTYQAAGDWEKARNLQHKAVEMIQFVARISPAFLPAAKAVMKILGVDCGPVRPPLINLTKEQTHTLQKELQKIGFFEYCSK